MSRRNLVPKAAALTALAVVTLAGATLAASPKPSLTITQPTANQQISKAAGTFAVAGTTNFTNPLPTTTKLYMRWPAPGGTCGSQYLDDQDGTDSSCQTTAGALTLAGQSFSHAYPADPEKVPFPYTVDASRNVDGEITIKTSPVGVVNHIQMDVTVSIGEWSATQSFDSGQYQGNTTKFNLSIDLPDELDKVDINDISLFVTWKRVIHVRAAYHTAISHDNPSSFINLPTYSASFARNVEVSVDDSSFFAPTPADVDLAARTFHLDFPSAFLSVGNHIVYARAIQGGVNSSTRLVPITVTA